MTPMPGSPRVLMVVRQFYPWIGGTERQAQQLAARLAQLGVDVRVVTGWWQWGSPRRQTIDGVPVFRNFTGWNLFGVRGLRKLAGYTYMLTLLWHLWQQRRHYDLIHVHLLSYPAWCAVGAGRWLGKKTVIKLANSGRRSDLLRMRQNDMLPGQRQMLPGALRADRFVALSAESAAELRAAGVAPDRIARIPNGVALGESRPARDYRLKDEVTVAFVGRLHPSKGLPTLLHALRAAVTSRAACAWNLWLVGDGPERPALTALVHQLGLERQVTFWGQVDDVASRLDAADLFVLPSVAEGMSNALLEAMARGLPCVATTVGSNPDLLRNGETGLLVPPEDAQSLAQALIDLADDEALRGRLGRHARQSVETEYSLEAVAQRYLALYHELLGSPAPAQVAGAAIGAH